MHLDTTILLHVLPALGILLLAEVVYMIREHRHDNKDMLSSISLTLGHLPISAVTKVVVIYFYTLLYQYRLFTIPVMCWWAWVICFFSDDFSYYWFHRCSHQVRFLWASHKVHHSSEKFTLSSGLRIPWTSDLTGTFLFWAWMPLIGIEPSMVIFMKSVSAIYQFWMHTETIAKLPKWFEAVFNTPSHHRVHHASNVEYLDKNHAGTLIIWDKIFGTYQEEKFKPKYGLTEDIKSFNPFVIAFHEWKNMFNDFKKTKKLKDRLRYFFNSPGWSHDGSAKTTRQLQSELKTAPKSKRHKLMFPVIKL
jgi:sterol desaturase/sphingolipid hydroxylase (fatty acid hydroxylase superfamily)